MKQFLKEHFTQIILTVTIILQQIHILQIEAALRRIGTALNIFVEIFEKFGISIDFLDKILIFIK